MNFEIKRRVGVFKVGYQSILKSSLLKMLFKMGKGAH